MSYSKMIKRTSILLVLLISTAICSAAEGATANSAEKISVYAAASLTNAMQALVNNYHKETQKKEKPVTITPVFASSSTLARQIAEGAPADLFISADQRWMDYLAKKKRIKPESRVTLLSNKLVLIAPLASPLKPVTLSRQTEWKALLPQGYLAVGDPDHVPVGNYAKEALSYLGVWQTIAPKLARTSNVRAALALVEQGEAPLGIIYSSDLRVTDKVKMIATFPDESHQPIAYPMALIIGKENAAAKAFSRYLQGSEAEKIFNQYGFTVTR